MHCVYILKSLKIPGKFYVGTTKDLEKRLSEHAIAAKSNYTYRHAPWKLETCTVFSSPEKAQEFEKYLKTGSGRVFLKKHLI